MDAGSDEAQTAAFVAAVQRNAGVMALATRVAALQLPGGCLAGGCLFQTVWNLAHGFEPSHGIADYDVFYFDATDLSAEAEAEVGRRVHAVAADLGVRIDVRNQARVHLWYEAEYGAPSPPFRRVEDGIDHFLAPCCACAVHVESDGLVVYAPFGYEDLFALVVRPNPRRATTDGKALRLAYESKVARWLRLWPRLQVTPWETSPVHSRARDPAPHR